jgi:hypothetical protein
MRVRRGFPTSSSGIIASWRYSVIGLRQSVSWLSCPIVATICSICPRLGILGPAEASGEALSITVGSYLPGGVPCAETSAPSSRKVLGAIAGVSSLSRMEGLKRSCTNRPRGVTLSLMQAMQSIGGLVISSKHVVELKTVEFLF